MSIVKAINELSGKEAVTIEDAIRNVNISGGGSSDILIVGITLSMSESDGFVVSNIDKTYDEIKAALESGKCVVANTFTEYEGTLVSMATLANCSCRLSSSGSISFTIWGHNSSGTTLTGVSVIEIILSYNGTVSMQACEGEFPTT